MKTKWWILITLISTLIPGYAYSEEDLSTINRSKRIGIKVIKKAIVPIRIISATKNAVSKYEETGNANDATKKLASNEAEDWKQIATDVHILYEQAKPQATNTWNNMKPLINEGTRKSLKFFDEWMSSE